MRLSPGGKRLPRLEWVKRFRVTELPVEVLGSAYLQGVMRRLIRPVADLGFVDLMVDFGVIKTPRFSLDQSISCLSLALWGIPGEGAPAWGLLSVAYLGDLWPIIIDGKMHKEGPAEPLQRPRSTGTRRVVLLRLDQQGRLFFNGDKNV